MCTQCDECGDQKNLSGEFLFSPLKRRKKIFHSYQQNAVEKNCQRYYQNAVKNNFSPLSAECGERKFFIAKIANFTNIHR